MSVLTPVVVFHLGHRAAGRHRATTPRLHAVTAWERTLARAWRLGPVDCPAAGQPGRFDGWTRPTVSGRWPLGAQYCACILKFLFRFKNFQKIIQNS
jgi:hypothetical protein